ncbi:Clp protease ClpP [Escherichia coli]|nr:head maturation protease, ClpP-related [Escherichia coli]MCN7823459.1 Clp protease ClpP [Escherichia coli]
MMPNWWEIKNSTGEDDSPAELLIYGYIGEFDEVSSSDIVNKLKDISSNTISVKINSYGGSVFTAQAILSSLKRHKANITVYIDGIAASAATIIAMAGDKIIIPSNAMMMIHNPWTFAAGDADELRDIAEMMDKIRNSILSAYKEKTGLSEDKLIELMDQETWLNAEEAVELGFADEVEKPMRLSASIKEGMLSLNGITFEASRFSKLPDSLAKLPQNKNELSTESNEQNEDDIVTLDELKNKYPELYNQVFNAGKDEGVKSERERIETIENSVIPGHDDLVKNAKFKTGVSAADLALEIMNAELARNKNFLNQRQEDASEVNDSVDVNQPENNGNKQAEAVKNVIGSVFKNRDKN